MTESEFTAQFNTAYDEKMRSLETHLNIAVVGKVSAGKSSLINALLERERSNPVAKVGAKSGVTTNLSFYSLCENVTIIDCPGLNDIREENSKVTKEFLVSIDIGILVVSGSVDVAQKTIFDDLKANCKHVFVVLNKIDEWDDLEESELQDVKRQWREVLGVSEISGTCTKGYDPKMRKDAAMDLRGVDDLRDKIMTFLDREGKLILLAKHLKKKERYASAIIASAVASTAVEALLPLSTATITATQLFAISGLVFLYTGSKMGKDKLLGVFASFVAKSVGTSLFILAKSFLPPTVFIDVAAAVIAAGLTFAILSTVQYMLSNGYGLDDREMMLKVFKEAQNLGVEWKNVSIDDLKNKDKILKLVERLLGKLVLK